MEHEGTFTARSGPAYYRIEGNIVVAGPEAPRLTLEPGTVLKFNKSNGLYVGNEAGGGALYADGATKAITLTQAVEGSFNHWSGVFLGPLVDTSRTLLRQVTVQRAGNTTSWNGVSWYGNLNVQGCTPTLTGCTLSNSLQHGLQLRDAGAVISDCLFSDNGRYGVYAERASL